MKRVLIKKFQVYIDRGNYTARLYLMETATRIAGIINFVEKLDATHKDYVDADGNFTIYMVYAKYEWCIHLLENYKTYLVFNPTNPNFISSLEASSK